jgi:hydroxymethylpyrimidine/phosphomethylpyrimidine kinase
MVRQQVEAIINDLQPQVVKLGLLRRIDVVEAVAEVLSHYRPRHVIYAPVKESSHGERLLSPQVYEAIERLILPLCTVVLEARQESPHGTANQLSSVVAVLLNRGEQPDEAIRHAHELLADLPVGYVESMGRSGELYNQFLDAVERFYYRYADVAFYAEQLNVSSPYLGQVTRRIVGRSPKIIIDERITSEIVSLLTTTTYPLKEIAHRLGFSSQAHLSRFFKKQKGISPLQYRQK